MQSTVNQLDVFVQYVRTKQFWRNTIKNSNPLEHVSIQMNEIKRRFLINPVLDINKLIMDGEIERIEKTTIKGYKSYQYKTLKAGYYNLSLLEPKGNELDELTTYIMNTLDLVSLEDKSRSTEFFDCFLTYKDRFLRQFFTIDLFSSRIHTPITSFKSEYRSNILLDGEKTVSLDVVTMQPLLLGKILSNEIGENDYSNWINSGEDIYLILQEKSKLNSREEAKKRFFEILFSKPNKQLSVMFGGAQWIEWINCFKCADILQNPHNKEKKHSNLAWLLQSTEVKIMRKVWQLLKDNQIIFLTVHDEIIVKISDYQKSIELFEKIMNSEFQYYKINNK